MFSEKQFIVKFLSVTNFFPIIFDIRHYPFFFLLASFNPFSRPRKIRVGQLQPFKRSLPPPLKSIFILLFQYSYAFLRTNLMAGVSNKLSAYGPPTWSMRSLIWLTITKCIKINIFWHIYTKGEKIWPSDTFFVHRAVREALKDIWVWDPSFKVTS